MKIDYLVPSPRWKAALSVFGYFASTPTTPAFHRVPALLPNLHVRIAGSSSYRFGGAAWVQAPRVTLVGSTSASFEMKLSPDFEMICVGFLPSGWFDLFGMPAATIADQALDASDVWRPALVDRLWHDVVAAKTFDDCKVLTEAAFDDAACSRRSASARQVAAVVDWLERPGALLIDDLVRSLDLSSRQVERIVLASSGVAPKLLAMKYRALRVAGAIAVHGERAVPLMWDSYTDQSHFIRDFRRFVGSTPGEYARQHAAIAHATMHGRWAAGVQSRLGLLS